MGAGSDENSDVDSAGVYFVSVEEFEQREPSEPRNGKTAAPADCAARSSAERGANPL